MTGCLIVLEGGDGSGKSTQTRRLADRLRVAGHRVVETFEPGATELGARIRALVLEGSDPLDPVAEALLMAADRAQHVAEVLRPALERGDWVVSDRFVPSSLAYQGVVRGLGVDAVAHASRWATSGLEADLVVVLDVDDDVVAGRGVATADRLERAGTEFHAGVRAAYRKLAEQWHWIVIDANGTPDEVAAHVWAAVEERLDV